ncbi:hypothetical protein K474DRAFT_81723 [Panus rudis PR-1116 ss-1]|nr:hypothetical protein K474DRAFT_81723 [Panus rudis PR-1116 ss-1]
MAEQDSCRWSELVPPHTALTFAAIWDPAEGIITFSGGDLLDADLSDTRDSSYAPDEAFESESQVLTIDRFAWALASGVELRPMGKGLIAYASNRAGHDAYHDDQYSTADSVSVYSQQTRRRADSTSSTAKIWSIGKQLLLAAKTPFDGRIFSHCHHEEKRLKDRRDGAKDGVVERDEASSDEGFFEEACFTATGQSFGSTPVLVNLNLKSTFSMTTTSTTNYVHVRVPSISGADSGYGSTPPHHVLSASATDSGYGSTPPRPARPPPVDLTFIDELSLSEPSEVWSTLPQPHSYAYPSTSAASSPSNYPRQRRKLLRKHVPASMYPVDPNLVLAREDYNHVLPPTPLDGSNDDEHDERWSGHWKVVCRKPSLAKIKGLVTKIRKVRCNVGDGRSEYEDEDDEGHWPGGRDDMGWQYVLRCGSVLDL